MADKTTAGASDPAGGQPGDDAVVAVYQTLRELARRMLADERQGHTLQPTALVHEAYLRLGGDQSRLWSSRTHFYHAAAEAMRRVLVDHARSRGRQKRGGGPRARQRLPASVLDLVAAPDPQDVFALDDALTRLERQSPDIAAVVRLRFFAGLSVDQTAEALNRSARSVDRDWSYARAWLYDALNPK
jgi:RNA polymerase sigma factor (TIGR02999 family)